MTVRPALPKLVAFAARRTTGWKISLGDARIRWRPLRLAVRDFTVANPAGFPEGPAIDLREVYLEYGAPSENPRETRLRELRVDVARLAMLRRADGLSNWDQLVALLPEGRAAARRPSRVPPASVERPASPPESPIPPVISGETPPEPSPETPPSPAEPPASPPALPPPSPPPPPRAFRIEKLVVKIGTLEQRDEVAAPGAPSRVYELNRTLVFTNVTDFAQLSTQFSFLMSVILAPDLLDGLFRASPE